MPFFYYFNHLFGRFAGKFHEFFSAGMCKPYLCRVKHGKLEIPLVPVFLVPEYRMTYV